MPWIQSLRFVGPIPIVSSKKHISGTIADKYPSFFDEDMNKWKTKFEKQINERNKFKKIMSST
jgi:hypothetical protein